MYAVISTTHFLNFLFILQASLGVQESILSACYFTCLLFFLNNAKLYKASTGVEKTPLDANDWLTSDDDQCDMKKAKHINK